MTCANPAVVLWCRFLQYVDERLSIWLSLVNKQQQMQLQVSAKDPLSRLLCELHYHRQTMFCQERTQRVIGYCVEFQVGSTLVKLSTC